MATTKKTLLEAVRDVGERIAALPERARATTKMAASSGLLWEIGRPGARAVFQATLAGGQNPALIYRIHGKNSPNKVALIHRDRQITYGELDARLDLIGAGLAARGIGRGKGVLLMMKNRIELVELGAALSRVGGSAVAISWRSTPAELCYLANHSGAVGLVFEHDLAHVIEAARPDLPRLVRENLFSVGGDAQHAAPYESLVARSLDGFSPENAADEDAAVVIYTSGTTGKPKGAVRKFPRGAMPAMFRFIAETPMRVDDVHLVTCPLYHSTAFGFVGFTLVIGGTCVIMDEFKPEKFLELTEQHHVTTTALVPTMLHRLLSLGDEALARYETRSLRVVMSGGAPLAGPLATAFMDKFGDILFNFYGATETGLVTLAKPQDLRAAPGTIGRALPANEIRLLDDAGRDAGDGPGELFVKNALLVDGYHADDDATRASMSDGYFSVGDLARRDRDGRYFIEGRKRDMIISGGVNVYPAEVEGVLETHPDIAEVAVVGVEDPEWGERVRAFLVVKPGASVDPDALRSWTRERLAGPKVPRDFVPIEALPRNPTGKVLKRELRALKPQKA